MKISVIALSLHYLNGLSRWHQGALCSAEAVHIFAGIVLHSFLWFFIAAQEIHGGP